MKAAMAAAAAAAKAKPATPKVKPKGGSYRAPSSHKKTAMASTKTSYKHVVHTSKPQSTKMPTRPAKVGVPARPTVTKPINGVIVKTLVKPANKSHVTIKSNMLGKSNGATKIVGNGLVGPPRKATLTKTPGVSWPAAAPSNGSVRTAAALANSVQPSTSSKTIGAPQAGKTNLVTKADADVLRPGKNGVVGQPDKAAVVKVETEAYSSDTPLLDPPSVSDLTSLHARPSTTDLALGPPSPTELGPAVMTPPRQDSPAATPKADPAGSKTTATTIACTTSATAASATVAAPAATTATKVE